jgi:hypothetical protein
LFQEELSARLPPADATKKMYRIVPGKMPKAASVVRKRNRTNSTNVADHVNGIIGDSREGGRSKSILLESGVEGNKKCISLRF